MQSINDSVIMCVIMFIDGPTGLLTFNPRFGMSHCPIWLPHDKASMVLDLTQGQFSIMWLRMGW